MKASSHSRRRLLIVLTVAAICAVEKPATTQTNSIPVDWPTRSAACGPKVTQPTTEQFKVTGVNDLPFEFRTATRPQYVLIVHGTPASQVPPTDVLALFLGQQASAQQAATQNAAKTRTTPPQCPFHEGQIAADLTALRTSNLTIPPVSGSGAAATLQESFDVSWAAVSPPGALNRLQQAYSDASCTAILKSHQNDPILQWLARLNSGDHTALFSVNVNPNTNYKFKLMEKWSGNEVSDADLTWRCGETDILSLSVGPMFTTLPYRAYTQQTAPVPPGATTTQNVLSVSESSNILGAALLNYHLPQISVIPDWLGLAVSVGPVYALGNAPNVSRLGFFAGGSVHLYRSFFLTPGFQIAQFADFPLNFTPGAVIPNGFGALTPVTRNTVRFAVGVTFKTNTFKSSSQNSAPVNTVQPSPTPTPTPPAATTPPPSGQPSVQPQSPPVSETTPVPPPVAAANAKWTVLVYMNAKNNLECDALVNFAEMESIGSTAAVQIVAELGRPKKDYGCGNKWSGVYRFHVERQKDPSVDNAIKGSNLSVDADMGSAETLAQFVTWGRSAYPADHYLLIIWNHGQGWRFQTAIRSDVKSAAASGRGLRVDANSTIEALGPRRSQVGGFKSVSFDDDTGNFLYNSDIVAALTPVLKGSKVDVLGFDACLMAMIETGYAMQTIANVMVGSEELEPGAGWKYDDFIGAMNSQAESLDGPAIGKLLVASYKKQYGDIYRTTLSALALEKINTVSRSVSTLADQLSTNLTSERAAIAESRSKCRNYGQQATVPMRNPIDLSFFAAQLAQEAKAPTLKAAARDVIDKVGGLVIANYASQRLGVEAGYGSHGLSIYFPATKTDFNDDVPDNSGYLKSNADHPVAFVKEPGIHWADFVSRYLGCSGTGTGTVCP